MPCPTLPLPPPKRPRLASEHGSILSGNFTPNRVSSQWHSTPGTNGVIERLFRTLKEQIVHGRVFQTIDEVRHAVRDFAARCNAEWLIGKNGYRSPIDARAAWLDTNLRRAA